MSLLCRLKNLVHKGVLKEKDLERIVIIPKEQEPCEDCISRQAVDELSEELVHTTRDKADFLCNFWEGLRKLSPVTQKPKTEWIPVSEKLPSDCNEDWVLAQIQENNGYLWKPCVAEYRKGKDDWYSDANDIGWLKNHRGFFKVIAWMPLPKPYELQERSE